MAVSLTPNIKFRWLDSNGNPLSGGLVYTYISGSTIPATTWTDTTGAIQNTNPVVLDSSGYASIYLLDTQVYRFVIKNAAGVIQQTVDDITSAVPTASQGTIYSENITATSGQTVVTFEHPYLVGSGNLMVYVNGRLKDAGTDYTETNANTITFASGLTAGDDIQARFISTLDVGYTSASLVEYDGGTTVQNALDEVFTDITAIETSVANKPNWFNIKAYGGVGNGTTNDLAAYQAARTAAGTNGVVYLPEGTFYFAGSRPDLTGCYVYADPGAAIKVDENPNTKDLKLITALTVTNPVHGTTERKPANVFQSVELYNLASALANQSMSEAVSVVDWSTWYHRVYNISTGDITTLNGTGTLTSTSLTWATTFIGNPQVIYNPLLLNPGELYEMNAVAGGSANTAGVFVKMMDGTFYRALFTVASASIVVSHVSATGTILSSSSLTLPNGGAYGWVANHELSIGFGMGSGSQIYLTSNGLPIYQFPAGLTAACGWYLANGSNCDQVTFKNPLKWTGWQPRVKRPLKIALIGDSTTYCAWASIALEDTLVMALQNSPEIGNVEVTNLGVSGTNSAYWVTQTATMDFSSYDLVLVMVGTNDQQGNISLATYEANLTSIRANIAATNTNMVWGVFPVYTSAVQSGITGVTTSNYAYSAGYVHTLWKWIATNGYSYADVRAHFGSNLAWYSDNIHPSVEGLIAYTAAWTEGVRRFMVKRGGYLA